ncbi:hypothetical protein HYV86_02880 [Candidatus Woesearchaeota archaeon]|nr:hypothetical protein [Candidatus Woesearchaeota archaeon]
MASEDLVDLVIVPHRENREQWRRETWVVPSKIDNAAQLEVHLTNYVQHYFRGVHHQEIDPPTAFDYAKRILNAAYQPSGFAEAVILAKRWKIDDVIDTLAKYFEAEAIRQFEHHP